MKNLNEILKQTPIFLNNFLNRFNVIAAFEDVYLTEDEYLAKECPFYNIECWLERKSKMDSVLKRYKNINILFASYGMDNWEGSAFVLFEENGKLYEVNGSHCSCYGLEDQWNPEEVTLKDLEHRLLNGTFGEDSWSGNEFKKELMAFLGITEGNEIKP